MTPIAGFIVVRRENPYSSRALYNPCYRGICRIPTWPSDDSRENALLEQYVFELRNDSGVIEREDVARHLASELEKVSGRGFEVLACAEIQDQHTQDLVKWPLLGYDVAGRDASFWSITLDFPFTQATEPFHHLLNRHGLFNNRLDASQFLNVCRQFNLMDAQRTPYAVFQIELASGNSDDSGVKRVGKGDKYI